MAGSIDDRVVSMSFDNGKFEAGVAKTLASLAKLGTSLKNIGSTSGLSGIEKSANKINFSGLTTGLDKLKQKLSTIGNTQGFSDIEKAANKTSFGPLGTAVDAIKGKLSTLAQGPAAALDALKEKLKFTGASKGLDDLEAASSKVRFAGPRAALDSLASKFRNTGAEQSFSNMEKASGRVSFMGIRNAITSITSNSFPALEAAAAFALGNIATQAINAGGRMVKSLSLGPVIDGFKEYSTNLNSIQTILANTQASGATLKDVNAALLDLNKYSDKTIYNFSEMAKNIGTFTAAGVDLKTSTQAIKGIANLAALSGSNSQQASTAMYQLSQAISAGRVSLQDWNSVVNAGMGGTVFQRALAQTAEQMGTIKKGAVELKGPMKNVTIAGKSFRESITAEPGKESWLTSKVLTTTLKQFTGDLSNAQLKAMGFNEEQIKSIQLTAKSAQQAATQVKTIGQVFDVAKETIGSGWAQTFQTIFGDFGEAKTFFTGVSNAINGVINKSSNARNAVLADWKELGGRDVLIKGLKDGLVALQSVLKPLKDAFRQIFPKKTGEDLYDLTKRFAAFTESLKIGPETADKLKRTFAGFFAVLHIGTSIIGEILGMFANLLGAAKDGSGGFLNFTGTIGDFLVSVDKAITGGEGLSKFFDGLGSVLAIPIKLLGLLADALGSVFGGGDTEGVSESLDNMTNSLHPMESAVKSVKSAWDGFLGVLRDVKGALRPLVDDILGVFGDFGDAVAEAFRGADYDKVFSIIQTTLIGGIFLVLKKALAGGLFKIDLGGGLLKNMSGSLETLTGSLKAMQRSIQAGTLLKIAAAVGVLAVGVKLLSTIDPKRLASAMTAVTVGLAQLVAAMFLLSKGASGTAFLTMPFIAGSLVLLAGAVDVLAIAVFAFSKLSWEELTKGLVGVGGALLAVAVGVKAIPPSVALIGPALIPVAIALNLLAVAVKIFSTMDWEELAKGLVGVGGSLTAVALGLKLMPSASLLLIGPGLIAVAVALNLLALAVRSFGSMDLKTMAKGLGGIAASLVLIGASIRMIPPTVALQAAGLVLLSIALTGIAGAVALMGGMSMGRIAKGLGAIGASLVVLGAGLKFIGASGIPGSIALAAAAAALTLLVPVIGILGTMKWSTIAKGIGAIALVLGALGVAGLVAGPGITALGLAMIPLAASLTLVGGGVYLLSTGIAKLGKDGAKNISALMVALTALVALLPKLIIDFLKGLVDIGESLAALAPKVVDSMVKIIESLLEVVIRASPKMAEAATALITALLNVLVDNAPNIVEAGFKLLLSFLSGINDNIIKVTEQTVQIVVKFLTTIAENIPKIIAAGATLLIKFLEGLASNLPKMVEAAAKVIVKFLEGITRDMPKIIAAGVDLVVSFVKGIADNVGKLVTVGADLIVKTLKGVADNIPKVAKAATDMIGKFFDAAVKAALDLADAGAKAVINFINGVADAIRKHAPELGKAGGNLGEAIIQGAITGMGSMAGELVKKALGIFGGLPGAVKKFLGIHSPSTVFMEIGKNVMLGMVAGVDQNSRYVNSSIEKSADEMVNTMVTSLRVVPDLLDGLLNMEPVITPVLDLSSVEKEAKRLGDMTNVVPITAAASYSQAASISAAQEVAQTVTDAPDSPDIPAIKFEQNNYSPEALSTLEVYRRTNNQLSQAKAALGII